MVKQVRLGVNELTFYKSYIGIINILYKLELTRQQQYMFAELLYQNNKYKDLTREERNVIIFSTVIRKEMMDRLKVDVGTFNNNISLFRKQKGLQGSIIQGKELNENYIVYPDKDNQININLQINYGTTPGIK